jgi:glycine hydroxymethyltransferase
MYKNIELKDKEIEKIINRELKRQTENVELIASENFVSNDVLKVTGSILTNKYAEGYPGRRYYNGCDFADQIESVTIDRVKKLFGVNYANVQPHSGSQANTIAYAAILSPGDKILGMSLNAGGHLTHGHKVNFSGKLYEAHQYGVDKDGYLDFDAILKQAKEVMPKVIVAGASAYSRTIDFKKFREIADAVGAYLIVDMAHIAGLVATGNHPSPVPHAHIVTSTVHKTIRGARGGFIITNDKDMAIKVNKACFPGNQGGPLMHSIAGKGVAFKEALSPEYKTYINNVCENAKVMAERFVELGAPVVSGGTDNHLFIVDVFTGYKITGKKAADALHEINITLNMNSLPNDIHPPMLTSGIRIGTPAMTTKGFTKTEFIDLANMIDKVLRDPDNTQLKNECKKDVKKMMKKCSF